MPDCYKTVKETASDEFIINKSRFIVSASPCPSEEEALAFLRAVREKYRDATHHCYAYIIGPNSGIMRYSDDGEPGGTAGLPIIEGMKTRGVTDCCVVVTRYFGGVLLGTGGLFRAYARGCALALNTAKVVVMQPSVRILMEVSYPLWDKVNHAMRDMPLKVENIQFAAGVEATICMRLSDKDDILRRLTAVTDGRAQTLEIDTEYCKWEEES